jgi:glycerol-1-phosphate dehydrogenase [NAD(P)+]
MPLLARTITAPLVVDIRPGAIRDIAQVLADQRISAGGQVAIVVGTSSGEAVLERIADQLPEADVFRVEGGTLDAALRLAKDAGHRQYDALVGVGGGRVLDVTKFAGARLGLPVVTVATNLAHDGIGSPTCILDTDSGRGSYGVPAPIAILVDLEMVRVAPPRSVRAGIGETLSNICAVEDWQLAHERTGEAVDGLAMMLARSAADAVLYQRGTIESDAFLHTLAESLVLSGQAMVIAGTSRPCSGACHEISHAIDLLFPDRRGWHGEQVGVGAAFGTYLRKDEERLEQIVAALRWHDLPVVPADLGLSVDEFTAVVLAAPQTRPGRHTILEELALSDEGTLLAVKDYIDAVSGPAWA